MQTEGTKPLQQPHRAIIVSHLEENMRGKRRQRRPTIEDPGNWEELQRTPEIKTYSQGLRHLVARNLLTRIVSLAAGIFITFVVIYGFGGPGIEAGTTDEGRKVFIMVSVAWGLLTLFFTAPVAIMVYRSRWTRVSRRRPPPAATQQLEQVS